MASLLPTRFSIPNDQSFFSRTQRVKPISCSMDSRAPEIALKLIQKWKSTRVFSRKSKLINYSPLIESLNQRRRPDVAHELFLKLKSEDLLPNYETFSALMFCFLDNGLVSQAHGVWEEILNSSFVPDAPVITRLMDAYAKMECFEEVSRITKEVTTRHPKLLSVVYPLAVSCFSKMGQVEFMENTLKEMTLKGIPVDSFTRSTVIRCYSAFGSLELLESAYGRFKKCKILIEEEEIRAVVFAYLKQRKFYRLREFLCDVGLERKNVGNLLWNSVLLSYAADFKMKSLQREFLKMKDSGFSPDLTTFNIRALAFSRMALFWDLHLTLEHMRHLNIVPDLVTFGCVVDAYIERRMARNLEFAYKKMNLDDSPVVLTDPFAFEVLGKGDFHQSSEAIMEFSPRLNWTYRKLISIYLKKKFRRDQIFWNY